MPTMPRLTPLFLVLGACATPPPPEVAAQQTQTENSPKGVVRYERPVYVGLSGTYVSPEYQLDDYPGNKVDQGFGGLARVGYQFDERFGAEVLLDYVHELQFDDPAQPFPDSDISTWAATANFRIYPFRVDLREQTNIFAFAGYGLMRVQIDPGNPAQRRAEFDGWTWRFGAGLESNLDEHWAFLAEGGYLLPEGHIDDFPFWSVSAGLVYRF